jgi:hypothetical protein
MPKCLHAVVEGLRVFIFLPRFNHAVIARVETGRFLKQVCAINHGRNLHVHDFTAGQTNPRCMTKGIQPVDDGVSMWPLAAFLDPDQPLSHVADRQLLDLLPRRAV